MSSRLQGGVDFVLTCRRGKSDTSMSLWRHMNVSIGRLRTTDARNSSWCAARTLNQNQVTSRASPQFRSSLANLDTGKSILDLNYHAAGSQNVVWSCESAVGFWSLYAFPAVYGATRGRDL